MSDAPAGRTPPQLRVGDRERREVDDRLVAAVGDGVLTLAEYDERAAVLWQARTRAELDELVADLPATGVVAAPPRADTAGTGDGTVVAADGRPAVAPTQRATSVAVPPSGAVGHRSGHLRRVLDGAMGLLVPLAIVGGIVLAGPDARSVFGSNVERVSTDNASVEVSTLFGSVTVIVPDGAQVDIGGLVVFGSTDCEQACGPPGEDASGGVVDVRGVGAFGSIEVLTESEHEAREARQDREEREEDAREAREEAEEDAEEDAEG